ncbi:IWS1-like protein isoform X2 [Rhopilema esculentum]|uniref:IWS1-like protein isoform X2 n=1 Tax=Rhopilema esculentum TaxID=499914 RepID=UPI0031DE8505
MASNEEYDVEDITPSNSPDNDSDEDEDDAVPPRPAGKRIAHKEMRNIDDDVGQEAAPVEGEDQSKDFENGDDDERPKDTSFEDISGDEENEAFSAGEEESEDDQAVTGSPENSVNIADKESDVSDNEESTQVDESKHLSDVDDNKEESPNLNENTEEQQDHADADYIDAPIPSPFSDIGDISGAENAMITDILKETNRADHISPELEGFAHSLESTDVSLPVASPKSKKNKEENKGTELPESPTEPKESTNEEGKDNKKDNEKDEQVPEGQEQGGGDVGGLIADIFGDSDEEDEEFEGFGEEELKTERMKLKSRAIISDDEDDSDIDIAGPEQGGTAPEAEKKDDAEQEIGSVPMPEDEESSDDDRPSDRPEMISDFDLMMQRKKEAMSSRRRRKRDFEIINDNDDIIAAMIRNMREAAEEDRLLNQAGRAATKKLKMLDSVVSHLNKADLQHTFIDGGVLPVMKEWLSPLPDNSLPHIMIRKQFLKLLSEFPALDSGALKMSGIGRAVMLLYKHPKETRENRNLAGKIVAQWARPIFGVQTNFKDVSREEREERDKINAVEYKKRRLSSTDEYAGDGSQDEKRPRRPGDKGFIVRARVPRPSTKDYVIRPKSDVGGLGDMMGTMKNSKKSMDRFEKQMRKFKDRKKTGGSATKAVSISINGSKMAL